MRSEPQLNGPLQTQSEDGRYVMVMRWSVRGDNYRWYHTDWELTADLLANDLASHAAFKKVIAIAEHHANAPKTCVCFTCMGLLRARD